MQFELPLYDLKTRNRDGQFEVFDPVRQKYVEASPEELVRQNWILYLSRKKEFPISRMAVEREIVFNNRRKRFDLLVADQNGAPLMLFEFKAPQISLSQQTFNQLAVYNQVMQASYLLISNGEQHFLAMLDHEKKCSQFLDILPSYIDLLS